MDLREWLFFEKMTVVELCRILDYSRTHMTGIVSGALNPSRKLVTRIEKLTGGKVTKEDFKKYKTKEIEVKDE